VISIAAKTRPVLSRTEDFFGISDRATTGDVFSGVSPNTPMVSLLS
jgi:hypothetical protein